jgi:hypothetical protein
MSDADKALWLTNRERIDRGVDPLEGTEVNVTGVAETYANYMLDDDCWGHECDGRTPWERLADNPAIGACHDFLSVAENLAALRASGGSIPLPVEQSVYMWMYQDKAISWGHRHTILWYPYNDNSGGAGMEGFLGIGRASGSWQSYPVAEIIVMNVFDPCASWGDADGDGITDDEDNCPMNDNPAQADMDGDCIGDACDPEPEVYDPSVPDMTPPGGNGCGDACECHADCDSDGKIQLTDLVIMKQQFTWICSEHLSCETDCNYSGKVDLADLVIMKYEFMRTDCPVCP